VSADTPLGGLTERVQWQRRTVTPEADGGHAVDYLAMLTLWARVRPIGLSSEVAADARGTRASHAVVIRHRSGIVAGDRFLFRGRKLEVLGTEDISGRGRFLACRCIERQVTG
jgi:SPP1 family predicted phage head-tail adaptor